MSEKIKLSFVNKGEAFEIPHMTVLMQEQFLEKAADIEKKIKDEDMLNREMNKQLLLLILQKIDSTVTVEHVNNMHPNDFIYLFNKIWNSGRELTKGDDSDFRVK